MRQYKKCISGIGMDQEEFYLVYDSDDEPAGVVAEENSEKDLCDVFAENESRIWPGFPY